MEAPKLFDAEYRFAEIVWELEPINSTELVKVCEARLGWKKSTTYTVLNKLCGRSILQNKSAMVTSLVKRSEIQRYESEALINKSFKGSLPAFVASFLHDRRITKEEADELARMIQEAMEDD